MGDPSIFLWSEQLLRALDHRPWRFVNSPDQLLHVLASGRRKLCLNLRRIGAKQRILDHRIERAAHERRLFGRKPWRPREWPRHGSRPDQKLEQQTIFLLRDEIDDG